MSLPLWTTIQPSTSGLRLMLSVPDEGTVLKARLLCPPRHPRALGLLLEALAAWYRLPLHAVVDADGPLVQAEPELWALLLGELPGMDIHIEWASRSRSRSRPDRFLDGLGSFASARRVLNRTATGQP